MLFIKEEAGWIYAECLECGQVLKFRKNDLELDKTAKMYRLSEDVECFCENRENYICEVPVEEDNTRIIVADTPNAYYARNIAKCPTCGSEMVEKISTTSKVVGVAMVGVFSSNLRKSFKCKNCGYKW